MSIRAAIFDVYGTLLEVGPAQGEPDLRWRELWETMMGTPPPLSRLELSVACSQIIARQHTAARARGVPYPEIIWEHVLAEALPPFAALRPGQQAEFVARHIQTGHSTRMGPEVARTLRALHDGGCVFGIASNAQDYTISELGGALAQHGLSLAWFQADLCFWSYEHGFSKPDPHVFQFLSTRLARRGIGPSETIMVGDRIDNDIQPARLFNWNTWQVANPRHDGDGTWEDLVEECLGTEGVETLQPHAPQPSGTDAEAAHPNL